MIGGIPFTFDGALPDGTKVTPAKLVADDRMESSGWLYEPAGTQRRTVVVLSHPRAEFGRHYSIPALVRAGYAALGHNCRHLNNDVEIIHERVLLDVAAALRWLRGRGFERIVLHGNSGGGALCAAYLQQAALPPERRATNAAGGGRVDLRGELPAADGLIVSAAHAGEGRFLLRTIDPSVTDENDPLSCDPSLDMFNPANGYDLATRTARYSPEWLARYRAAQRARVERLDLVARSLIAAERGARGLLPPAAARLAAAATAAAKNTAAAQGAGADESRAAAYELHRTSREAIPHTLMRVYRTVANPAYLDLSIEPNDRPVGSIFGLLDGRPEFGNYFNWNIARALSPRAWLSVWSGLSSRVNFCSAASAIAVPVLFVHAAGDTEVPTSEADAMWNAIAAADRTRHDLRGADHYLRPVADARLATGGTNDPRKEMGELAAAWLERRFPG